MSYRFADKAFIVRLICLIRLLRPKQWVKNVFVFAPLLFSGEFMQGKAVYLALMAALLFCTGSAAAYVVNDIFDIQRDRRHPIKSKSRPLAAGDISVSLAGILLLFLYSCLLLGWFAYPKVVAVIGAYILLNLAYTTVIKHHPVVDIFTIAIGFVLRVYAGAIALDVPLSAWMFITTLCLALYLASIKRRQEIIKNGSEGRKVLEKYTVSLVDRYAEMSATGALVFYSMFAMSIKPELIFTIPLVIYGLFRYWFVVEMLEGGESPTDALIFDWQLLLTVLLWGLASSWALQNG